MDRSDAPSLAPLWWASYAVALLFIFTPLVDFVLNVWPLRPGGVEWRYGSVGLLSGFLLTPLLGVLMACGAAAILKHRTALRVLSVLAALGALLLVTVCIMFVLDAVQYRAQVPAEARGGFDAGTLKALAKHGSMVVALVALALGTWLVTPGRARAREKTPLVRAESDRGA